MAFRKSTRNEGVRAADIFKAATGYAKERSSQPNIFLKLFRGEIKLILTFWTFFLTLPLLGDMLFTHVLFPLLDVTSSLGTAAMFLWGTFMLVYGVIASVGLWRSAKAYAGPRQWAVLSQLFAVLGVPCAALYAVRWYASWMMLAGA